MPTYTYRREDGTEFDIIHGMNEKLEVCPDTGQPVTRIINWEGSSIIHGWSAAKELKKEKLKHQPGVTTLPHYKEKIDANTEKAIEEEEKRRK
jgi:hypothetical protein